MYCQKFGIELCVCQDYINMLLQHVVGMLAHHMGQPIGFRTNAVSASVFPVKDKTARL